MQRQEGVERGEREEGGDGDRALAGGATRTRPAARPPTGVARARVPLRRSYGSRQGSAAVTGSKARSPAVAFARFCFVWSALRLLITSIKFVGCLFSLWSRGGRRDRQFFPFFPPSRMNLMIE